jgi:hypothetical protein
MATVLERPITHRELSFATPQIQKSPQEIRADAITAAQFMLTDVLQRRAVPQKESLIQREHVVVFLAGAQQHAGELQDREINPEVGRVEGIKRVLSDLIETGNIPNRYKRERHPEVIFQRMILQDDKIRELGRNLSFDEKS